MVVVLIGPPGCGKGTQGRLLSRILGVQVYSTGDILRSVASARTPLGNEVRAVLEAGRLVNDELVNSAVAERLESETGSAGCILDGYPRTVAQAEFLDRLLGELGLPEPLVLNFEVDEATLFARLSARRYCPVCGRIYNLISQPPAESGYCDDDGMALVTRADDKADVIGERLRAYQTLTAPVLSHYGERMHTIHAAGSADAVLAEIEAELGVHAMS